MWPLPCMKCLDEYHSGDKWLCQSRISLFYPFTYVCRDVLVHSGASLPVVQKVDFSEKSTFAPVREPLVYLRRRVLVVLLSTIFGYVENINKLHISFPAGVCACCPAFERGKFSCWKQRLTGSTKCG